MDVDLDLREEGNLCSVCAPGGCDAQLSGDQKAVMKRLHTSLAVLVKRFDPAKQNISALPLTLLWESAKEGVGVATVLGFRTYTANLDMIWLEMQLESSNRSDLTYGLQPPYTLKFKTHLDGTAAYFNEMSLCVTLARIVHHDIEELLSDAARLKEEECALRAAWLMQRAQRPGAQQRKRRRAGRPQRWAPWQGSWAGQSLPLRRNFDARAAGQAQPEDEEGWLSELEEEDDVWGLRHPDQVPGAAAAEPHAVPAGPMQQRRNFRYVRQDRRRGIPCILFELEPIVSADGEQTGWGAVFGQHLDRDSCVQCKKAVSLQLLDDETCLLRLKRWLYAGLSDEGFPVQAQRRHHVGLGGPHLQQFADGPDKAEMDAVVAAYTAAGSARA